MLEEVATISVARQSSTTLNVLADMPKAGKVVLRDLRCARPSTRAPIDSRMTSTVAMDMMTAHTMTATVSSLVRPTGNCRGQGLVRLG